MINLIQDQASVYWDTYCEYIPELVKFDCPKVSINNRTYRTAGRCYIEENRIELSGKLLKQHWGIMLDEILQHELCHQIDYNLNPKIWTMRNCHSKQWVTIGNRLGIELKTFHTLEYKR